MTCKLNDCIEDECVRAQVTSHNFEARQCASELITPKAGCSSQPGLSSDDSRVAGLECQLQLTCTFFRLQTACGTWFNDRGRCGMHA